MLRCSRPTPTLLVESKRLERNSEEARKTEEVGDEKLRDDWRGQLILGKPYTMSIPVVYLVSCSDFIFFSFFGYLDHWHNSTKVPPRLLQVWRAQVMNFDVYSAISILESMRYLNQVLQHTAKRQRLYPCTNSFHGPLFFIFYRPLIRYTL